MTYIAVIFTASEQQTRDILVARLSELQYEGFEEDRNLLKAYIASTNFEEEKIKSLAVEFSLPYQIGEIPETNWNSVWESNFQPVEVGDFCAIRASFHAPNNKVQHEIVITPKMSFGTGHHPTTFMMIEQMAAIDFKGKTVFDFGTGTGVLSILAKKLGAEKVIAIDNDDWSIENARENIDNNNAEVTLIPASKPQENGQYDILLANITRNVIIENFPLLSASLRPGGILLLSGLLQSDEQDIIGLASKYGMRLANKLEKGSWICLRF